MHRQHFHIFLCKSNKNFIHSKAPYRKKKKKKTPQTPTVIYIIFIFHQIERQFVAQKQNILERKVSLGAGGGTLIK